MAIFICADNQISGCPANRKAQGVFLWTQDSTRYFFLQGGAQ
jgi:hypothetical protein